MVARRGEARQDEGRHTLDGLEPNAYLPPGDGGPSLRQSTDGQGTKGGQGVDGEPEDEAGR